MTIAIHKRAARALALTALAAVVALPATTEPAFPAPTQARTSGHCVLFIINAPNSRTFFRVSNICTPRVVGDRLVQSIYYGDDWPDHDDWLFDHQSPPTVDSFIVPFVALDEDIVLSDEIYTRNRFVRPNGSIYELFSNVVHKQFRATHL